MTRVLVVDDSSFQRQFLRGFLEAAGFEVDDFLPVSPLDITERVKSWHPDLLLTDYIMPHLDGEGVVRMARRADPALKMVVLTATRDEEREGKLRKLGVMAILHKPMKGEDVAEALKAMLS